MQRKNKLGWERDRVIRGKNAEAISWVKKDKSQDTWQAQPSTEREPQRYGIWAWGFIPFPQYSELQTRKKELGGQRCP